MRIEKKNAESFPEDELVAMMLGKKLDAFFPNRKLRLARSAECGKPHLRENKAKPCGLLTEER